MKSGVPLSETVVEYGGLARPRWHKAFGEGLALRAMVEQHGVEVRPIDDKALTRYIDDQAAGKACVTEKLRSGELVAFGFEPGAHGLGSEPARIHAARWYTLTPDFESSRALDNGEVIAAGILVYSGAPDPEKIRTGSAGRPSLSKALIEDEFERRATAGELRPDIGSEVAALLSWLKMTHPNAERPTPKTVRNNIAKAFRALPK